MRKYIYASRTTGLSGNRVATWAIDPDAATSGDALGWSFTSFGAIAVPELSVESSPSDSDFRTQLDRMTFTSSSVADSTAGLISSAPVANRGSEAGRGGLAFSIRFALPELFDATRGFIGLSNSSTSLLVANPYTADVVGIGFGDGDVVADPFRLIHFDGSSGAYDPIVGAERDPDSVYEFSIFAAPHASTATLRLVELRTGAVLLDDVILADRLPTNSEMLYVHATVGSGPEPPPPPDPPDPPEPEPPPPPKTPTIDIIAMRLEVPDGDRAPEVLGASGYFSVKDFGAFGNYDSNDSSPHDDTPAFLAALRAMAGRGGILFIPPGDYFLASSLLVDLNQCGSILVQGVLRGTARSLSRVHFGEKCGIRVVAPATPRDHTQDAGPPVLDEFEMPTFGAENLTLFGSGPRAVDSAAWTDGEPYVEHATVVVPVDAPGASFQYYYECISDGTSGSTPPDFAATFRPAPDLVWSASTTYAVNDVVRVEGIFDRIFLCIESGWDHQSGGSAPTWPAIDGVIDDGDLWWRAFDAESYFVADGGTLSSPTGPVWACRTAPGIYSEARVSLRRVTTELFFNSGVHLQVPEADRVHACAGWGSHMFDVANENLGGGFVARERADEGSFTGVFVRPYQHDDPSYLRHLGIVDQSRFGNAYVASRLESFGVALTVSGEDNVGTSIGDYYESNQTPDLAIDAPNFSVWGSGGTEHWRPTNAYGVVTTMEWMNVQATSTINPLDPIELSIEVRPDADRLFAFGSSDDTDRFAYVYGDPESSWWGLRHGASQIVIAYLEGVVDGAGAKLWLPRGFRLGPAATAKWIRSADFSTLGSGDTPGEIVFNANPALGIMAPVLKFFDGTSWLDGPILP